MSGFQVGVSALAGPAQRLKQIGTDLGVAGSGAASAAGSGSAAAGAPNVSGAADVFKAGVQSVLATLGQDAGLLGDKVQRAGVTYEAVDNTAMPKGNGTGDRNGDSNGPPGTPPHPAPRQEVKVSAGDSLWGLAAKRLPSGASNAQIAAEVNRWYEANRDVVGPDRLLNEGSTLHAPDEARSG